jgi:hypothetical protein
LLLLVLLQSGKISPLFVTFESRVSMFGMKVITCFFTPLPLVIADSLSAWPHRRKIPTTSKLDKKHGSNSDQEHFFSLITLQTRAEKLQLHSFQERESTL